MFTRRSLLKHSALLSMAPAVPGFLSRTAMAARPERDGRILVVVQLDGGNDGINTVVPFGDEDYARHRRELRIPTDRLCKLTDRVGLHPAMRAAADLVQGGRLAIIQGVGYPNPDRSHFKSMAIWQTGRPDGPGPEVHGWLGRALDGIGGGKPEGPPLGPSAVFVGERDLPRALRGRRTITASFADPADLSLALPAAAGGSPGPSAGDDLAAFVRRTVTDAYATAEQLATAAGRHDGAAARYPDCELGRHLELVARSIKAGATARVYYAIQSGYDTHAVQLPTQARLLGDFAQAIRAFLDDLAATGLADGVLLLAFSEFGRRPAENGSLGTDHGTAGPVFLAGPQARAGLIGDTPRLGDLVDGDLKWSIDFRRVYATLLDRWLGLPAEAVLGQRFEPLPILRG
jgi:uncharacterized protein (DUF1501 family)